MIAFGTRVFSLNCRCLVSITLSLIGLVVSSLIGQSPSEWTASSPICTLSMLVYPSVLSSPLYSSSSSSMTCSPPRLLAFTPFLMIPFLSSSFSFYPNDHVSTDIQLHRNISASLLSNDVTVIEKWGKDNLVSFNQSKTKQAVVSRKRNQNFPAALMNGDELDTSASFTQLGLSLSSNLTWKTHIHSLAKHASQKLGFLARARGFFSSSHLLSICKSQIRPSLEYCSHVWGGAPKSTLCLHDKVQSKATRLINNPNLTKSVQPLSHRCLVGDLSIFYRYFNGHCSQEIRDIIPVPLRRVKTTRSSTHSHPFQVFTAYFTNFISQIIIHPKHMHFMERLAFFLLSCILKVAIFQI